MIGARFGIHIRIVAESLRGLVDRDRVAVSVSERLTYASRYFVNSSIASAISRRRW